MMPSVSSIVFALSALVASVSAHPVSAHHEHVERAALPTDWYHPQGHASSSLFRRQDQPVAQLPKVGTPEWKAKYPSPEGALNSDEATLPKAWVDAYKAALANGLIPQVPPTVLVQDENYNTQPTYPAGFDASSPEVCSSTVQCYNATDIVKAPDGFVGIGFDDGPTVDGSPPLYDFLSKNHIRATHFLIGRNIINNPELFLQAFRMNGDLAVHTWTHPYMTAQSDLGVLAELGWTMQVIHDSTGGRVPRYWRPAYGDMDQRVRGIAEHVFGLTAVMWNHDTNDWAMPTTQTAASIATEMEEWLSGPKNPGLMVLQHELSADTANVFINTTWAGIQKHGWRAGSVAQLYGKDGFNYANAKDNLGAVVPVTGIETAQQSTGTVPLPTWWTGSASTSLVTATAPATDAPAPPANTDAPLPPANTDAPVDTNTQSPADGQTSIPHAGGGAEAPSQTPSNSNDHTSPPKTSDSAGNGAGAGGAAPGGTNPGDAAGIVRPQLALSAVVAAAAFLLFA